MTKITYVLDGSVNNFYSRLSRPLQDETWKSVSTGEILKFEVVQFVETTRPHGIWRVLIYTPELEIEPRRTNNNGLERSVARGMLPRLPHWRPGGSAAAPDQPPRASSSKAAEKPKSIRAATIRAFEELPGSTSVDIEDGVYYDFYATPQYKTVETIGEALAKYLELIMPAPLNISPDLPTPGSVEDKVTKLKDLEDENEIELPDPVEMKKYWKEYSPIFALEVAKALPKAYELYKVGRLRARQWGPTLIAEYMGTDRARVSTFINKLIGFGWTHLNGISLKG